MTPGPIDMTTTPIMPPWSMMQIIGIKIVRMITVCPVSWIGQESHGGQLPTSVKCIHVNSLYSLWHRQCASVPLRAKVKHLLLSVIQNAASIRIPRILHIHTDDLQLPAVSKGVTRDPPHTLRDMDLCQIVAIPKRIILDDLNTLTDRHGAEILASDECHFIDDLDRPRNHDIDQARIYLIFAAFYSLFRHCYCSSFWHIITPFKKQKPHCFQLYSIMQALPYIFKAPLDQSKWIRTYHHAVNDFEQYIVIDLEIRQYYCGIFLVMRKTSSKILFKRLI